MMTIEKTIEEIKELRGAVVKVFGQPHVMPEKIDTATIDIVDVLESLVDYQIDINDYLDYNDDDTEETSILSNDMNADDIINTLMRYGYIDKMTKADNSYNWGSPVSNDFDFKIYEGGYCKTYVELSVHRYGDVRCNYTDSVVLEFDSDYEFYELLLESNKYIDVQLPCGLAFNIEVDIFHDTVEVYDTDGNYICEAYGWNLDDIIHDIMDKINK